MKRETYYAQSNANMNAQSERIAEMEDTGLKVVRRDIGGSCRAVLLTPEVVHLESKEDHQYYPNAIAELYTRWKGGDT